MPQRGPHGAHAHDHREGPGGTGGTGEDRPLGHVGSGEIRSGERKNKTPGGNSPTAYEGDGTRAAQPSGGHFGPTSADPTPIFLSPTGQNGQKVVQKSSKSVQNWSKMTRDPPSDPSLMPHRDRLGPPDRTKK